MAEAEVRRAERRLVWDLPVRVVHWALVVAVIGSWITNQLGPTWFSWHLVCGCTVLVLVAFRVLWGFVGTRHARFGSFVRGPAVVWRYLRGGNAAAIATAGHNPLGALSVILLLLLLLAQALTGLFSNDAIANTGPLYGWVSGDTSDLLTSIHHRIFVALEVLIGLHVLAVLFYTVRRHARLIGPMFSGYKPAAQVPAGTEIQGSRLPLALALLALITAALLVLLHFAPPAGLSAF